MRTGFEVGIGMPEKNFSTAVHKELRLSASHYMRLEGRGHVLQPTALVNEVYLRLAKQRETYWQTEAISSRCCTSHTPHFGGLRPPSPQSQAWWRFTIVFP
jgi:hypothetical protein